MFDPQAVSMAVQQQFGHLSPDAAGGVAVRHDYGSNFMANDFQKTGAVLGHGPQLRPSTPLCGEPKINGVIERLFRTLKEEVVHGRIFHTIKNVRDAVRNFATRYNTQWLIEKNGHLSPDAMR